MKKRDGFSLLELAIVLAIVGIILLGALPAVGRGRDAIAVGAARAEMLSAIATGRAAAVLNGGASVVIDGETARLRIVTAAGTVIGDERHLGHTWGVRVTGTRPGAVTIRYDALGIGRLANASLRVERGRARATVTVSAYGRAR